jgi:serine/threonine-protein kinase RsbW
VKASIPSDFVAARPVQKQILDEVAAHGYGPNALFAIKLALEEALINAIKHGNKLSPNKTVTVEAHVTDQEAEIIVEDQGPGFVRAHVPDPTIDENMEKCSGRGILLIETYMSSVEYSHGGRRVRMVRKNVED